jgi:ergothioneine biosynthesis protein EgtB
MLTQPIRLTPSPSSAAALLERFRIGRAATMRFCSSLTPEDMMVQSCPEASPIKWHLAHTSWFFETFVLSEFVAGYQPFDPNFRWLFNSYYRAVGPMPEKKLRASFSRPPLDQVLAYRRHVDAAIARLLCCVPQDESQRRIVLGLEHEQQHLELAATDIKHAFFTSPLHPAYKSPTQAGPKSSTASTPSETLAPPLHWLSFTPGSPLGPGLIEVGVTPDPNDLHAFAFDNETPRHPIYLAPFQLASRAVTCSEYLAFIEDDGYSRPELWLSEGWDTMRSEGWQAPLYWVRDSASPSGWSLFTLHGFRSLGELSETPVCHLSFFEADAFARWSGQRLPTESEWEFVASHHAPIRGNFLESAALHPQPATNTADPADPEQPDSDVWDKVISSAVEIIPNLRIQQLFGDVWEWTQSPYIGYPGYKPLPGALGEYNGKFMSSQMVLRGGSCVTPQSHIRATYRNFFSPSTRWQFSGLRLARDGA